MKGRKISFHLSSPLETVSCPVVHLLYICTKVVCLDHGTERKERKTSFHREERERERERRILFPNSLTRRSLFVSHVESKRRKERDSEKESWEIVFWSIGKKNKKIKVQRERERGRERERVERKENKCKGSKSKDGTK